MVALLLGLLFFVLKNPNTLYNQHLRTGNEYYRSGDYYGAVREYKLAQKAKPNDKFIWMLLGMGHYKQNRYQNAIEDDTAAIKAFKDWKSLAALYFNRGLCYQAQRHLDLAAADYRQALKYQYNNSDAMLNLADCCRMDRKPEEALKALESYHKINAPTFGSYIIRANCMLQLNRFKESEEDFAHAASFRPGDSNLLANLAWTQYKAGEVTKSIETNRRVLGTSKNMKVARFNLALALATIGNAAEAKEQYDLALDKSIEPDRRSALLDLNEAVAAHPDSASLKQSYEYLQKHVH